MLVLHRKQGQKILVNVYGQIVEVIVAEIGRGGVRIAIEAAKDIAIYREEVAPEEWKQKVKEKP